MSSQARKRYRGSLNTYCYWSKRSQSEKATGYTILTVWHSGKGKVTEPIKRSAVVKSFHGGGCERWIDGAPGIFRAVKLFFMMLSWWIHDITHLSKPIKLYNTEYEPQGNLSVQFSHSVVSNSLQPHGLQHTRLPCSSPTPGVYSNLCPSHQWCYPTISSSVIPFSSRLQSFPESGSFQMSQLFTSSGQSTGVSASVSVLPKNIQDQFPLGWTG